MTFENYLNQTRPHYKRANAFSLAIRLRARTAFNSAFNYSNTEDFSCFHLAHNWADLPSLTPIQREACAYVIALDHRQWCCYRIADRIANKLYSQVEWGMQA